MNSILNKESIQKREKLTQDNLILIDKPAGWTSFDVVKKVRSIGRFKKIGHGGTLDPFATGLLILATGKKTKTLHKIISADKTYLALIEFGKVTDSFDISGRIRSQHNIRSIDYDMVKKTILSFVGESEQIPPMFSAKQINGQRLYKLARQGREIERKPKTIKIYDLKILKHLNLEVEIFLRCSKGTYIRTLANDIGIKTGYGAYLKRLRLLEIDNFSVEDAFSISQFESFWHSMN